MLMTAYIGSGAREPADLDFVVIEEGWPVDELEILFLENVGNLVCPTSYDLGEAVRAVLLSVTEGEDKPLKYPATFHHADLVVLNKIDLLPYVPFSMELAPAPIAPATAIGGAESRDGTRAA